MLLATIVLLCSFSENENVAKAIAERSAAFATNSSAAASRLQPLPSTPQPKIGTDVELRGGSDPSTAERSVAADPLEPRNGAARFAAFKPIKPELGRPRETPAQRKVWYTLMFAGHGAAAFDAWSTRNAISGGYGTEANPLLRPFAGSGLMYAATQVSPVLMDFLGKRMMTSRHGWVRRVWWLPQAAGMSMSVGAGIHNVRIAR
jgi:hypothetical protein